MSEKIKPIYFVASTIYSPLGDTLNSNYKALLEGKSAVEMIEDPRFADSPLPLSKFDDKLLCNDKGFYFFETRFDTILMKCISQIQKETSIDWTSKDCLIILSTTKGNIEVLNEDVHSEKLILNYSAKKVVDYLNNPNEPIVISNACISGMSACIVASRLLRNNEYKHIMIVGCDALSQFVISGFSSFHAISKTNCKPFDKQRDGITLGEAAAACVLSREIKSEIQFLSGTISNDANHISGPSRTGEELSYCIQQVLSDIAISPEEIDFVCAHGTATPFNDEMESLAIEKANLLDAKVFSLKAQYGHTLGASGVLEIIIAAECLKQDVILPSMGFFEHGVSGNIQVNKNFEYRNLKYAIKTGSGFGGCNAAVLLAKIALS